MESQVRALSFSSRWCKQSFICPAEEDSSEYLTFLLRVLEITHAKVLIASSDGTIELIRRHREKLEKHVKIALAKEPALGIAIDKNETLAIAASLDIPVPRGILVSSVSEIEMALREIHLPIVIKPVQSWTANGSGHVRLASRMVTTRAEARHAVEDLTRLGGKTLFQQFVIGKNEAIGLFCVNGEILARFAYRIKRMDPPLGGTDVMGQSIPFPEDIGEMAENLVKKIGYEGYCLVEFRRDKHGTPYLMEINSRLNAGISHAVKAGIDFPYMLYQWALGEYIKPVRSYRTGIWLRYLSGDIATTAASIRQRGRPGVPSPTEAILGFVTSFFVPTYYDSLDWSDPYPVYKSITGWIRNLPALIGSAFTTNQTSVPTRTLPATPAQQLDHQPLEEEVSYSRKLELALAALLYYSGIVRLARWWTARQGPRLIVLCYHRATGGSLSKHLLYLCRHYRILHLEEALEALYNPQKNPQKFRFRGKKQTLLAVTFDDGYQDNYSEAFALATSLHIPITLFLVPGYIESGSRFWWEEPANLINSAKARQVTLDGITYRLNNEVQRRVLAKRIELRLRNAPSIEQRETFLAEMRSLLAAPSLVSVQEMPALPFTWSEVHTMESSGWVTFDAHTMHHPTLACLTDPAELRYEVSECRSVLERQLGHPVRAFAYPIGKDEHIGEQGVAAVRAAHYDWALTTSHGINSPRTDPHLLNRFVVDVDQHWLMVAVKASGVWDAFVRLCRLPGEIKRQTFKRE
jgi:predicted ATP-grasp superfamily ATP-dependent carboligase/peptidoglycan/xylan/chitin deacetylase (PgdA/CDA1 family)